MLKQAGGETAAGAAPPRQQPGVGGNGGWSQVATPDTIFASMQSTPANYVSSEPQLILDTGGFLSEINDVAFSADGHSLAVAGDKLVRVYDVGSGDLLATLRGDRSRSTYGSVSTIAYSPDGEHLLVGVYDYHARGSIRLYRTDNLQQIERLLPGHAAPCDFIRFSADGRYMASSDSDGEICLWDWPQRRILKRIPPRNADKSIIDCLQFVGDNSLLLAVEHDRPHIYRVPDGTDLTAQASIPPQLLGWWFDVLQSRVAWPLDTRVENVPRVYDLQLQHGLWAALGRGGPPARPHYWCGIWRARSMDPAAPLAEPHVVYRGHRWRVRVVAFSPDGKMVATGDKFGEVHLWDASTGKRRRIIKSLGKPIYEAAFHRDSEQIMFGTDIDYEHWSYNRYGVISKVIDLRQRVVRDSEEDMNTWQERPQIRGTKIAVKAPSQGTQSYSLEKHQNGRAVSQYRIPSGRHPAVFTLLGKPALGVAQPVLFGDNEGLLAMWDSSRDEMQRYYHGHSSMITSIGPATNEKVFVTSSTDRKMCVWSLLDHQRTGVFDFKYENSAVIEVKPETSSANAGVRVGDRIESVDGKSLQDMYELMMTGKFDYLPGQVVPVVMRRGDRTFRYRMTLAEGFDYVEPLLNIFVCNDSEWIIWTPKGYYDCSPGTDHLIGWHVNQGPEKAAKFYRAEQFKEQLYRPDIINLIIETGNVEQAIRLANQKHPHRSQDIDLTDAEGMAMHSPPTVTVPSIERDGDDPRVTVESEVKATNGLGIAEVTLLHNGHPAKVFRPSGEAEQQVFRIRHRCRLFPGRNMFALIASNNVSTSSAEEASVTVDLDAAAERSKVYVLAIGISQYRNSGSGFDNLRFAAGDAQDFVASVEKHREGKIYSQVTSKLLVNEQATRQNILEGFQWLVDNVQPNDVVMLFAACHGFMENDNFYLASHGVDKSSLRATGISWREIVGTLHKDLPACKRVVFLDACHSAGVIGNDVRSPLHDLSSPELGTIFYASCTIQQKSFESEEWHHGAFTKSILDILGDPKADFAPTTGDGLISTLELKSGLNERVKVITRDRQHPVVFSPPSLNPFNVLQLLP